MQAVASRYTDCIIPARRSVKFLYTFLRPIIVKFLRNSEICEAVTMVTMVTVKYVRKGMWTSSNAKLRESDFQTLLGATYAQVDKAEHKNTYCHDAITLLLSVTQGKTKLQTVAGMTCCEAASE
jgi:hypothetical protein